MDVTQMATFIEADSLGFLSIDGLYRAVGKQEGRDNIHPQYCDACFTGDYAIPLTDRINGLTAGKGHAIEAGGEER
jgi:amidophosphoribosyltransferase